MDDTPTTCGQGRHHFGPGNNGCYCGVILKVDVTDSVVAQYGHLCLVCGLHCAYHDRQGCCVECCAADLPEIMEYALFEAARYFVYESGRWENNNIHQIRLRTEVDAIIYRLVSYAKIKPIRLT